MLCQITSLEELCAPDVKSGGITTGLQAESGRCPRSLPNLRASLGRALCTKRLIPRREFGHKTGEPSVEFHAMRMIFRRISRPKHGQSCELRAYEAVLTANNGRIRSPQELIEILLRNEGRAHCTEFTARAGEEFLKNVAGFTGCKQCIQRPIGGRLPKGLRQRFAGRSPDT